MGKRKLVRVCVLGLAVLAMTASPGGPFAAAEQKGDRAAAAGDDKWKDIAYKEGDLPKGGVAELKFAPRTKRWRLHFTSAFTEKPTVGNADLSSVKLTIWEEEHQGLKRVWKEVGKDGGFKGKAGDGTDLEFHNGGTWPGGARREMRIVLTAQFVKYELEVQDEGDKPLTHAKEKAEKKEEQKGK